VFDALPSPRAAALFAGGIHCPWHNDRHEFPGVDLLLARRVEANAAALLLGADVFHLDIPEEVPETGFTGLVDRLTEVALELARHHPGATHHFVAGPDDVHAGFDGGRTHRSHRALWAAGCALAGMGHDCLFHRVYVYSVPPPERTAGRVIALTPAEMERKCAAIAEYQRWDPRAGRLAYGYHSVPELFDAASGDPHEYVEVLA